MLELWQFLAIVSTALFAGAALYINVAEHPARMHLETRNAVRQWAPSYQRATLMQAPLALIGLATGIAAWLSGAGAMWLVAALLIGAVVPFTFIVIMPTNKRLLASDLDLDANATRDLLQRWAVLHAFRTALSLASTAIFVGLVVAG